MKYVEFPLDKFFKTVATKKQARDLVWEPRFGEMDLRCPKCSSDDFYKMKVRPEVRECAVCKHQIRLRAGAALHDSRTLS